MPTPLHSPTYLHCTARGRPAKSSAAVVVSLRGWPSVAACFEACAGRRIRWLCPPAVPVLRAVCLLPPFACHAHCPHHLPPLKFACPRSFHFALPLFLPCAPGSSSIVNMFASCETVLLAAATRACSGGPCAGSLLTPSFSCRVHDPGPWVSVNYKLRNCLCKYKCAPPACLCHSGGNVGKLSV